MFQAIEYDLEKTDKAIDKLNENHAMIELKDGSLIATWDSHYDVDMDIKYSTVETFSRKHRKHKVANPTWGLPNMRKFVYEGNAWINSPKRRHYDCTERNINKSEVLRQSNILTNGD